MTGFGRPDGRRESLATLSPFLPDPSKATGAAVVAFDGSGGGFRTLSMRNDGRDVARARAARGVVTFVLRYRLDPTPADLDAFARPPAAPPRPANWFDAFVRWLGVHGCLRPKTYARRVFWHLLAVRQTK